MAYAVQAQRAGGPEVLRCTEIAEPQPGPSQLLVEVAAAGVNFIDTYRRSGVYPMEFPHIVGVEGSGRVIAIGEGVSHFAIGDRVAWHNAPGSYATHVLVAADEVMRVPDTISDEVAAAMPLQGLTADYLATSSHRLGPRQTALIHAGAGGVGLLLTQIAVQLGTRVITTVSTEEKAQLSRAAGAAEVLRYDEGVDIAARVREFTDGRGVDVAYDGVGRDTFDASLASVAVRGSLVLFGAASGPVEPFDIQRLNSAGGLVLSRPSLQWFVRTPNERAYRAHRLFTGLAEGWLDFRIGQTFPLEAAAEAHRALEGRQTTGKVILTP